MKTKAIGLTLMICALTAGAFAQDGERRDRRGPPQEALDACSGLTAGDACSFESRRGAVEGTCFTPSDDKPLACRPADHRGQGGDRREGGGDRQGAR